MWNMGNVFLIVIDACWRKKKMLLKTCVVQYILLLSKLFGMGIVKQISNANIRTNNSNICFKFSEKTFFFSVKLNWDIEIEIEKKKKKLHNA